LTYVFQDPNKLEAFATPGSEVFDEVRVLTVQEKLRGIQAAFIPTMQSPVCDIFQLTTLYNEEHVGEELNGTTVSACLNYLPTTEEAPIETVGE
jgi:hypothetical protein